jgi:RNA recognition motif-containing protein
MAARRLHDEENLGMRQNKVRGNIFVANLPDGYTDEQLAAAFDEFGLVLTAYLARDSETSQPKNYGLVDLAPPRAAEAAIAALNGKDLGGRKVKVKAADPEMALNVPRPPRARFGGGPDPAPAPREEYAAPAPARSFVVERLPARRKF